MDVLQETKIFVSYLNKQYFVTVHRKIVNIWHHKNHNGNKLQNTILWMFCNFTICLYVRVTACLNRSI